MQPSLAGLLVCFALMLVAHRLGGALVVGLIGAVAFGSTAIATLPALGGASPLAHVVFSGLLISMMVLRRDFLRELGVVFRHEATPWLLVALCVYAMVGAVLLPRFFEGETSVFVASPLRQGIIESTLAPTGGNITQTSYLVVGALTAIALCVVVAHGDRLGAVRRGFMLFALLNCGFGLIDWGAKAVGGPDLLEFLRTANYEMLSRQVHLGMVRLNGAFPEPSSFASANLASLAFAYTYWRRTGNRLAGWVALITTVLLLRSTASTAYAGLIVLGAVAMASAAASLFRERVQRADLWLLGLLGMAVVALLALLVSEAAFVDTADRMIDTLLVNKAHSGSGAERSYWNAKSIAAFFDTMGLGVGMGSTRASSWLIAVAAQLGVVGILLTARLVFVIAGGLGQRAADADAETRAVVASVRACALASLVAVSLVGGTADPGILFFVSLGIIAGARIRARLADAGPFATARSRPPHGPGLAGRAG